MRTLHTTFSLARQTVHQIAFEPDTFTDTDLLWLPHHQHLAHAAHKRKAEHLAGRIAAAHALQQFGVSAIPGIGVNGEPLWQTGAVGSITHTAACALAVVSNHTQQLLGIDCEQILDALEAQEIKDGIIDHEEETLLRHTSLPFALALTLTFSAKESLFKALFPRVNALLGFDSARVTALTTGNLALTLTHPLAGFHEGTEFTLHWLRDGDRVITLLSHFPAA
jgi:enterobactin synthetase component D